MTRLASHAPLLSIALALVLGASSPAVAQTGPFVDGELLLRAPGSAGQSALYRINPITGHGDLVVDQLFPNYSGAGWVTYDPYRDRLLAYTAYSPLGVFSPRLYAFDSNDALSNLGFDGQALKCLTPVGDGRIYCFDNGGLKLIDAGDNIQPVLDQASQPVSLVMDQLAYDASTNSLIGALRLLPSSPCYTIQHILVYRYPLNGAGTQLSGPVSCNSYDVDATPWPIGLDPLPGGDLLLTLTGVSPFSDKVFLRVNPASLAISLWGESTLNDLDGGVWNPALQRAIVLDDQANELRTFFPGQGGTGSLLPVDLVVGDGTTGVSAANAMADIELFGSACGGFAASFGVGLAGKGGIVPELSASTCPTVGAPLKLSVTQGLGASAAVVLLSAGSAPFPLFGGTAYVLPPYFLTLSLPLNGPQITAGAGQATTSVPTPNDPSLAGLQFYAQGGVLDAAALQGVSLTNALALQLG
ncbi:hypothetical protein [Engelhardtia mirabilis]|uniref:DUF4394 domain-containing protein n=1 Tax=Engelhardtia mirabilis TaxID=2528011 RepID=A0A518BFZ0_9BACT|nr:hypothetical protein Pla133_09600 [Planctomycetes bacterium Pla133]QDV00220.1 hypothetical protein Pla86_09590 [Planctomycetes bacterium Pla86]